jgi:hypothetical protein
MQKISKQIIVSFILFQIIQIIPMFKANVYANQNLENTNLNNINENNIFVPFYGNFSDTLFNQADTLSKFNSRSIQSRSNDIIYTSNQAFAGKSDKYDKYEISSPNLGNNIKVEYTDSSVISINLGGYMTLYNATLALNNSIFIHAAGPGTSFLYTRDKININLTNNSRINIDTFVNFTGNKNDSVSNLLDLSVSDSNAYINRIFFVPSKPISNPDYIPGSDPFLPDGITENPAYPEFLPNPKPSNAYVHLRINTVNDSKGVYNFTIQGFSDILSDNRKIGIQADGLQVEATNSIITVGGDILMNKGGSFEGLTLTNSTFNFSGNIIEKVAKVDLTFDSLFTFGKEYQFKTMEAIGVGFMFTANDSEALIGEVKLVDRPNIEIDLTQSVVQFHKITYDRSRASNNEIDDLDLSIKTIKKSTFNIDTIDFSGFVGCALVNPGSDTCATKSQDIFSTDQSLLKNSMTFIGDNDSTINITNLIIDNPNIVLNFSKAGTPIFKLENLNYNTNKLQMVGSFGSLDNIRINNINMDTRGVDLAINLKDAKFRTDGVFNVKNASKIDYTLSSTSVFINRFICETGCYNINYSNTATGTSFGNAITYNEFISNSGDASNNQFNTKGSEIIVNNNFKFSGKLNLNSSKVTFGNYLGSIYQLDLDTTELKINKKSEILLKSDININNASELVLDYEDVFVAPKDNLVNINLNKSKLYVNKHNIINKIDAIDTSLVVLKGGVNVETLNVDETSELTLHDNINVKNLTNKGSLSVYGNSFIGNFDNSNSKKLNFYINSNTNYASLNIDNMLSIPNNDMVVKVEFLNTTIFKPTINNKFILLNTKKGSLLLDTDSFEQSVAILPIWLKEKHTIENNNGVDDSEGQNFIVNIQRITNYKTLVNYTGISDGLVVDVANILDSLVVQGIANDDMVNIVNSIDYNSGCKAVDVEAQLLYEINQGNISKIAELPCLGGIVGNLNSLVPIHNEVFLNYLHNDVSYNMDVLLDENRNYYGLNDTNLWVKTSTNFGILSSKSQIVGYSSDARILQVGLTGSYLQGVNTSLMAGLSSGSIDSSGNNYNINANIIHFGGSLSYINPYLFTTLASTISYANFDNKRNVGFLVNQYSTSGGVATSNASSTELSVKLEVGTEFSVNKIKIPDIILENSTIEEINFVPKAFMQVSNITGLDFKENGSSAALTYDGYNASVLDVGVGMDFYQEFLLKEFLFVKSGFWQPKFSLNIKERLYSSPGASAYFNDYTGQEYAIEDKSKKDSYTGLAGEYKLGLSLLKNNKSFSFSYVGQAGFDGYIGNALEFTFRYILK